MLDPNSSLDEDLSSCAELKRLDLGLSAIEPFKRGLVAGVLCWGKDLLSCFVRLEMNALSSCGHAE